MLLESWARYFIWGYLGYNLRYSKTMSGTYEGKVFPVGECLCLFKGNGIQATIHGCSVRRIVTIAYSTLSTATLSGLRNRTITCIGVQQDMDGEFTWFLRLIPRVLWTLRCSLAKRGKRCLRLHSLAKRSIYLGNAFSIWV